MDLDSKGFVRFQKYLPVSYELRCALLAVFPIERIAEQVAVEMLHSYTIAQFRFIAELGVHAVVVIVHMGEQPCADHRLFPVGQVFQHLQNVLCLFLTAPIHNDQLTLFGLKNDTGHLPFQLHRTGNDISRSAVDFLRQLIQQEFGRAL